MSSEKKTAQRLARKVQRGIITLVYEQEGIQWLQVKARDGYVYEAPRIQEYGFTSVPHVGAQAVLLMIDDSNAVVVSVDDGRHRPKESPDGEVIVYDDQGTAIHIRRDGIIHCTASSLMTFDTPLARFTGRVEVDSDIKDHAQSDGYTMQEMRDKHDVHNHNENDSGGPTDPPNQQFSE